MTDRRFHMIFYLDSQGNPKEFTVGCGCTEIRELEESGEYSFVPWVEVWSGDTLLFRASKHKLEHIVY